MLQFCQTPNCLFFDRENERERERGHRGKVEHSESNPGNENRRSVHCPSCAQAESCRVGHWTKKVLAASPGLCTICVYGNAKSGYQFKVRPEDGLQDGLCFVRMYRSILIGRMYHCIKTEDFCKSPCAGTCYVVWLCLTSLSSINLVSQMLFHPIKPEHSHRVPLSNCRSRLMGQIPQFCYRKRDILVSCLLIPGRFLWLYFGNENWCFWLELATSVLHRVHLVLSLRTSGEEKWDMVIMFNWIL